MNEVQYCGFMQLSLSSVSTANDSCLDIASIVTFELSPFSDILVNLTVLDPNLKFFLVNSLLIPLAYFIVTLMRRSSLI